MCTMLQVSIVGIHMHAELVELTPDAKYLWVMHQFSETSLIKRELTQFP